MSIIICLIVGLTMADRQVAQNMFNEQIVNPFKFLQYVSPDVHYARNEQRVVDTEMLVRMFVDQSFQHQSLVGETSQCSLEFRRVGKAQVCQTLLLTPKIAVLAPPSGETRKD